MSQTDIVPAEGIADLTPNTTPDPPPITDKQISSLVKKTFRRTFEDFYERKPPSTLAFSNGVMSKSIEDMDEELIRRHKELAGRRIRGLASTSQNGTTATTTTTTTEDGHSPPDPSAAIQTPSFAGAHRAIVSSIASISEQPSATVTGITYQSMQNLSNIIRSKHSSRPSISANKVTMTYRATARPMQITFPKNSVEPVPPYWFCHDGDRSVYKEDENAVPFRYMFEEGDFDEDEYLRLHGNTVAWVGAWRDPDMDIIQAETVQRLKPYRLSAQQIDRTRILPSEHRVIFDLDLTRDLPPFPRATSVDMDGQDAQVSAHTNTNALFKAIPAKRKWELPLSLQEEQYEDNQDFYEENWCFRQNCWEADCTRHASLIDGVLYFSSFHYIAQPSEQVIMDKLAHTARPGDIETSCSDTCAKLRNEGSLLLASQQMRLRPNHEKEQKFLLDLILDGPEGKERLKPCDLKIVFPDHTCEEMAMRVMLLRREQEDLWRAKSLSSVPAPLELERAKSAVFKPAKYNAETRTFVECDHDGPCVKDVCICANRNLTCGKNCRCSSDCPRQWKGCQCRARITTGVRPVGHIICQPNKCPCRKLHRECDPALCGPCGASAEIERVQPLRAKKDNLSIREIHSASRVPLNGTCGNVEIQKGVYPRLRVGVSRVAGYGVFATEDLPRGTSIGEYVGEWISDAEGIRRDKVNSQIGRTYIFNLNADFEIDATNFGNYTRYFNSAKGSRANCETTLVTVSDEPRILFFTNRKINRNEEIRFDYGKSFDENAVDMVTNIKAKRAKNWIR